MRHTLIVFLVLIARIVWAQDFPAVTSVCTEGSYRLTSPLTDGKTYRYAWERSFDGGSSWQATGADSSSLLIPDPNTGISYRMAYATTATCLNDTGCRQMTGPTRVEVDIPEFSQGLSICEGDTILVGTAALTTPGNYRTVIATEGGCDSIVNTFLRVNRSYRELYYLDLCPGEAFRGQPIVRDTVITEELVAGNGCDSIVSFEIFVSLSTEDLALRGPDRFCAGQTATLRAPGQFVGYAWSDGSTTADIEIRDAGTYTLTVTDFAGCSAEVSKTVATVSLTIDRVATVSPTCPGTETATLAVVASGDDGLSYSVGGAFQQDTLFTGLAAGSYLATVENADGCSVERVVSIAPPPALVITSSPGNEITLEREDSVRLSLQANFEVVEWQWTPGRALSCTDCADPLVTTTFDTYYIAFATSPDGCKVRSAIDIRVTDNRRIYAPNAFSPDGNDSNDRWRLLPGPRTEAVSGLRISDRWGGVRYRQPTDRLAPTDDALAWDGTDGGGQPVPSGTYYFTALVHFTDGSSQRISGPINLLR